MKKTLLSAAILALSCFISWAQQYSFHGITYHIYEELYQDVHSDIIDINGGRDGVAWFSLRYRTYNGEDRIELEVCLSGKDPYCIPSSDEEPDLKVVANFQDGSSFRFDDSYIDYLGSHHSFTLSFKPGCAGKAFTTLRSKDINWLGCNAKKNLRLAKLAGSSAEIIDNLCHLAEVAGFIPKGLLGKSPHHHFSIDKELYCDNPMYRVGDRITIDGHEGIVFETSKCGTHGKVISVECSDSLKFYTGVHKLFGNHSFTNGKVNSDAIMAVRGWGKSFPALAWCKSLGSNWYLPSSNEIWFGLKVLAKVGIISKDEASGFYNQSTYGSFSLLAGSIDVSGSPDIDGLIYPEFPTYAVATF